MSILPDAIIKSSISSRQLALPLDLLNFGNRCGHSPTVLREFSPRLNNKPRPYLIAKATKLIGQLWTKPNFLKHLPANPSGRCRRSEIREALILTLAVSLHYMSLDNFEIVYTQGGDNCLLSFLAKQAGISIHRIKEAMGLLMQAGYITAQRRWKQTKEGTYTALASIRTFSLKFFKAIGITEHHALKEQAKKRKRMIKASRAIEAKTNVELYEQHGAYLNDNSRRVEEDAEQILTLAKAENLTIAEASKLFFKRKKSSP